MKIHLLLVSCACYGACISQELRIPTGNRHPLRAQFQAARTSVIEGRHLLIPIELEQSKHDDKVSFGSLSYSPSAWLGFWSGSGYYNSSRVLNLEIVDLSSTSHHRVFDRQVAVGTWEASFLTSQEPRREPSQDGNEGERLRYPGLLILSARCEDSNTDKVIDRMDAGVVFAYSLDKHELRRLSPASFNIEGLHARSKDIVMVLRDTRTPYGMAVYECDPHSGTGKFVVQGLVP